MWSARPGARRAAALLALLLVAGCGFEPLYGERRGGAGPQPELARVRVALIADRIGQQLRRYLLDRLGPADNAPSPLYQLEVSLLEVREPFGIQRDQTAQYARLTVVAYYTLRDLRSGQPVMNGQTRAYGSYNVTQDPFNTVVAESDARDRTVQTLGDELLTRSALYIRNHPGGSPAPPRAG